MSKGVLISSAVALSSAFLGVAGTLGVQAYNSSLEVACVIDPDVRNSLSEQTLELTIQRSDKGGLEVWHTVRAFQ